MVVELIIGLQFCLTERVISLFCYLYGLCSSSLSFYLYFCHSFPPYHQCVLDFQFQKFGGFSKEKDVSQTRASLDSYPKLILYYCLVILFRNLCNFVEAGYNCSTLDGLKKRENFVTHLLLHILYTLHLKSSFCIFCTHSIWNFVWKTLNKIS